MSLNVASHPNTHSKALNENWFSILTIALTLAE